MLPREPDAAVHLDVELGASGRRPASPRVGGDRRRVARAGRRPRTRRVPRPTPRRSPARWRRACWRSGASPPGTCRSDGRTAARSLAYWPRPARCTRGRRRRLRRRGSCRARSTSTWRAPGSTSAAAPSSTMRADRRVGSRFGGTVDRRRPPPSALEDRDVVDRTGTSSTSASRTAEHHAGRAVQRRRRAARRHRRGRPLRSSNRRPAPGSKAAA